METATNIAVIGDIHGHIPNLERVIEELSNEKDNIELPVTLKR